jgi:hypothetical protein
MASLASHAAEGDAAAADQMARRARIGVRMPRHPGKHQTGR